ncbi:MAG: PqqD family protein [Planctomycetota bacterium]|nr:PqqD family protein [Planctomycetota bacterium]
MARPRKMDHLIQHGMDDEVLVYDPVVDRTHRLNVSAALIWELCDGTRSLEDIARVLTEQFEVEFDTALQDARTVLEQLKEEQLLTGIPAA